MNPELEAVNFQEQILELVKKIPSGRISSYGQIARVLGRPKAARAVGTALNLSGLDHATLPWHRVLNKAGLVSPRVDPFCNEDPVQRQHVLLQEEGLEPDSKGSYSHSGNGMGDDELRLLFSSETLDLLNEHNEVIGVAPRSVVRKQNLLHRGVGILCWNSKGQLYIHQRTATKDLYPSCFDMMVGGAVECGESYLDSARREVQEELGVGPEQEPKFLLECLYEGPKNRAFIQLFEVHWEGPIVWQESEIVWGKWMDFSLVKKWVHEVNIVPDGMFVFQEYLKMKGEV